MNNEKNMPETPASEAVKLPVYKNRKWIVLLSVLLAVLVLFNAALITIMAVRAAGGNDKDTDTNGPTSALGEFKYTENLIKQYFSAFGNDKVTGLTVAGKDFKIDEIDDEYVTDYINALILELATASDGGKINKTKPTDFADVVYLYMLYAEKDGEKLAIDHFTNAYSSLANMQIGAGKLGKDFDQKLMGIVPANFGSLETDTMGTVSENDVIVISFEAKIDGETSAEKILVQERWDLKELDAAIKTPLLAACKAIGEEFTFDATHDIDEDGENELVHYTATVDAVAHENNVAKITATLPEDYFGTSMDEKYTSLNGEELDFYVIVSHSVAYEVFYEKTVKNEQGKDETVKVIVEDFDDLTYDFIVSKLGHKFETAPTGDTEEAKDAAAREAYFLDVKKEQTESRAENEKLNAISLIWKELVDTLTFESLPEDMVKEIVTNQLSVIESNYRGYSSYYPDFVLAYPTIEDYARDMYGYDKEDYKTYSEYIEKEYAPKSMKQMLLVYAIYNDLGVKNDTEKYLAEQTKQRKLFIEDIIASAAEQGATLSEKEATDYFYENYGDNYLEDYIMSAMVEEYLYTHNTVDWELTAE